MCATAFEEEDQRMSSGERERGRQKDSKHKSKREGEREGERGRDRERKRERGRERERVRQEIKAMHGKTDKNILTVSQEWFKNFF
jgi:hypothetical protein